MVRPRRVGPLPHPRVLTTPPSLTPLPAPPPSCGTRTARGERGSESERGQRSGLPLRAASHPVVARRYGSSRDVRGRLPHPEDAYDLPLGTQLLLIQVIERCEDLA